MNDNMFIHTKKPISTATLRIGPSPADPEWVDISIADGNGLSYDAYSRIATLDQAELADLIRVLTTFRTEETND